LEEDARDRLDVDRPRDEPPFDDPRLRLLDDERPRAPDEDAFERLPEEPLLEERLLEERLRPDELLRPEDRFCFFTSPSSIWPRHAPLSSSSIST